MLPHIGTLASTRGAASLHSLARSGDLQGVRRALEQGTDVDALDYYRQSPLRIAASFGQAGVVSALLSHGADVHLSDPLHAASGYGNEDCVILLLGHGAPVHTLHVDEVAPIA